MALLSKRRQYNQFNTLIKCSTFLQVDHPQIIQQASVPQINLQDQPNLYSSLCLLYKNTRSGPTNSNETTTLVLAP